MGHRTGKTSPCQQRINLRNSQKQLEELLAANWEEGAQLVTLTYNQTQKAPSIRLAALQRNAWFRSMRDKHGKLRYIRATEQASIPGGYPVHRVVLLPAMPSVDSLQAFWTYGPIKIEPLHDYTPEEIAALFMRQALRNEQSTKAEGRAWSPSAGLLHPKKENKHEPEAFEV